jgi:hypothetical protein
LQALIAAGTAEAQRIEYKRETYGANDEARREFLADISSFANARGGDVLIGVDAANGVPTALVPFTGDADQEILRLDSMARTGLEPRIPNLQLQPVPIDAGGVVLALRIPRSYRAPHRVTFKGSSRFWARSSAGKYEPNVDELRALFVFAPELAERTRAFRFERIAAIAAGGSPVPLLDNCCLVLHVVPFSHFDLRPAISLEAAIAKRTQIMPIGTRHPSDWRVNFDGLLTMSNENNGKCRAYVQIFRAGAFETVTSSISREDRGIDIRTIDAYIIQHTRLCAMTLNECGAVPPYTVMASLIGVRGRMLAAEFNEWHREREGQVADRDQLHLAEVVLEDVPDANPSCGQALRPMLDQLANAAGHPASVSFDQGGNCTLR